ncbi:hypothetical protein ACO0QE_003715 [Hanseniaspora vineae]
MSEDIEPCLKQACKIQDCLQKNSYSEDKCKKHIKKLYACCLGYYTEKYTLSQGRNAKSTSAENSLNGLSDEEIGRLPKTTCCPDYKKLMIKLKEYE